MNWSDRCKRANSGRIRAWPNKGARHITITHVAMLLCSHVFLKLGHLRARTHAHAAVIGNTCVACQQYPSRSQFGHLCNILFILTRLLVIADPAHLWWRAPRLYITSRIVLCNDQTSSSVRRQWRAREGTKTQHSKSLFTYRLCSVTPPHPHARWLILCVDVL